MDEIKTEIRQALIDQNYYDPHDVFNHSPEFWECDDERYKYEIRIVKWNTRSTRMTVLFARYDEKKNRWVFARKKGQPRQSHGENMKSSSRRLK